MAAYCGIGYSEFLKMSPKALLVYRDEKEKQEKKQLQMADFTSWMTGAYVLRAIGQVVNKNSSYPEKHIFFKDDIVDNRSEEEIIAENTEIASIEFGTWAKAFNNQRGR